VLTSEAKSSSPMVAVAQMMDSPNRSVGDDAQGSPGRIDDQRRRRMLVRNIIIVLLLCIFASVEVLNLSGFCYREMRYLSEKEFVDIAVMTNLAQHSPQGERNKIYVSLDDFYGENPNCCKVWYHSQLIAPLARIVGLYELGVSVYYKMSDTNERDKYYNVDIFMNACGSVVRKLGTAEDHGPLGQTH
jgi:hypothetical protein